MNSFLAPKGQSNQVSTSDRQGQPTTWQQIVATLEPNPRMPSAFGPLPPSAEEPLAHDLP
ncbi:hypothetical protein C7271_13330 [filamentous cyanobacterium CCP5]|nr:hypothetical protein C7271_13330 [filamentous cyanobacterium CCP5]